MINALADPLPSVPTPYRVLGLAQRNNFLSLISRRALS